MAEARVLKGILAVTGGTVGGVFQLMDIDLLDVISSHRPIVAE
jgi:hypothetical protein